MWTVTGTELGSAREYVYTVDAPDDADQQDVILSACRAHGRLWRQGEVSGTMDIRTLTATQTR